MLKPTSHNANHQMMFRDLAAKMVAGAVGIVSDDSPLLRWVSLQIGFHLWQLRR